MEMRLCKDIDDLLSEEAYKVYSPCMYKPTFNSYVEKIKGYSSDPDIKIFTCLDNDSISGILIMDLSDEIPEIIGIAVDEDQRDHGIASKMIRYATETECLKCIKAQTDDDAVGFFKSFGFSCKKEIIEYPDGQAVRYDCLYNVFFI